jgi:hypothetical protein
MTAHVQKQVIVQNHTLLYLNPTYFRKIKPFNTTQIYLYIYISIMYTFI